MLLLGAYVCCVSKLHQTLAFRLLLYVFAANAPTVCRARDLGFVALAIVFEAPRTLAVAPYSEASDKGPSK